ncbi:hypothetical protein FHT72_006381 [Rhizobium sp. BK077]|uniref:hypothetical protein n=1 Tax=unclassified Rhizobium TaxID=2613769 RepID=UPI001621BA7C|nr:MULTISPECIES: hypothetical protein [unclassified Rhizobium]MBB3302956.1 hypothetical protein [Rhizobium sp. BK112]MBB3371849.1 hypothetical protein [Rhizobium sp. BK077]MBB4182816.1 hypothetical protein [Rhizobium sp. BK109]
MQLIDTQVGDATEGMVTVEFQGEGGELVSVKMTAGDDLRGDAAINRAKTMMIQLTTFADDRDHSQDEWSDSSVRPSEATPEHPVVSSFGEAPSSAA